MQPSCAFKNVTPGRGQSPPVFPLSREEWLGALRGGEADGCATHAEAIAPDHVSGGGGVPLGVQQVDRVDGEGGESRERAAEARAEEEAGARARAPASSSARASAARSRLSPPSPSTRSTCCTPSGTPPPPLTWSGAIASAWVAQPSASPPRSAPSHSSRDSGNTGGDCPRPGVTFLKAQLGCK